MLKLTPKLKTYNINISFFEKIKIKTFLTL